MMNILIADDESIVLEGLKCIIDWNGLGFSIIGESKNGEDALNKVLNLQPDLVLLDIHMPKLHGTEVVKRAREAGYKGHFIILSGYSEFQYAQTAIRYGVDYYLSKPIDEDELINAILDVKEMIAKEHQNQNTLLQFKEKARDTILRDIINGKIDPMSIDLQALYLTAPVYQIVIYEKYNRDTFPNLYNFAELLRISNQDNGSLESVTIKDQDIILLKGSFTLQRFQDLLTHYKTDIQKGSPLDSIFLTYGREVYKIEHIYKSYQDALLLSKRRFFCAENQHTLAYEQLPGPTDYTYSIHSLEAQDYQQKFVDYLQSQNRAKLIETLHDLEHNLNYAKEDVTQIKCFLTDIYLQIKQNISHLYSTFDIPFPTNTFTIQLIENKYFLYEIVRFFSEQFEIIVNAISSSSSEHVLDDILHYISINYMDNLKLENIAHLFGYNSSYLGKIFNLKAGVNFNTYVDQVRIEHSKELLANQNLKVYSVAEQVGYKNVDYFHKKFKKYTGQSPAEYRKQYTQAEASPEY